MNTKELFENGYVYGVSYKPGDEFSGRFKKFGSWESADEWLHTEEYDFRERELCSKESLEKFEWLNWDPECSLFDYVNELEEE